MSTTGEIILKTMSDYWVVGKLSNLREFYVVIHQKNANLIEINGKDIQGSQYVHWIVEKKSLHYIF
jgi:hypothetical protein